MVDQQEGLLASEERARFIRRGRLQGVHWLVIGLSLVLTLVAWHITRTQIAERVEARFERSSSQVVELIVERMTKYEDALWAGVGVVLVDDDDVTHSEWRLFAETISLDVKYPGINGIGVIYSVPADGAEAFVKTQQQERPEFRIYPRHPGSTLLPITFIEPVESNLQAVGLDVAHETNRFTAATQALESGAARMTGPIVLVQDEEKTPGFLLYAPFRHEPVENSAGHRGPTSDGMVYAPFVVKKLMQGVLERHKRDVGIRIQDGDEVLYDELTPADPDFDPDHLLGTSVDVPIYGRTWRFEIHSSASFRAATASAQPMTILLAGLGIDGLLFYVFLALSRTNRRAIEFVDDATRDLREYTRRLERSNADLEQFAYVASHDLQEPLRMVGNFTQLLQQRYRGQLDSKADQYIDFAVSGVTRMQRLLNDLLDFSRIDSGNTDFAPVDTAAAVAGVVHDLDAMIEESRARIDIGPLPIVPGEAAQLSRVFQNLIANALKFRAPDRDPVVRVEAERVDRNWRFTVQDNGIGIEPEYFDRIFVMFKRLHGQSEYPGTGVGLAICAKIVLRHGGELWVESEFGKGSRFIFTLPAGSASTRQT